MDFGMRSHEYERGTQECVRHEQILDGAFFA
jgi:hypothetical protein